MGLTLHGYTVALSPDVQNTTRGGQGMARLNADVPPEGVHGARLSRGPRSAHSPRLRASSSRGDHAGGDQGTLLREDAGGIEPTTC